ncbi:2527_t:CDS:2, partial [Entrophospora sp. SA101]
KLLETEVSASSNPTRDRAYFRNKTLKQYPNLCREGSDENNDYYGITDESLCPICKSDHYEDKEWEAKLTELPSVLSDKTRSRFYNRYKNKTGLDPWINSETSESKQIEEDASNHLSRDCIIKISMFPEEKSIIHEAVHKRFPLSFTHSNAWYRDVFKYTDSKAECPVCKKAHTHRGVWGDWSCLEKNDHYFLNCPFRSDQKKVIIAVQSFLETQVRVPNKIRLYQPEAGLRRYAIEHGMDPDKFSVITEAEKNRWAMGCFREDLERDIRFYRSGIERNEDTRKYREF